MSTPTTARRAQEIALDRIEAGGNVRDLDPEHVGRLAASMKERGQLTAIDVVAVDGERFALVAGEHRLAAARELGWSTIAAVISEQAEGASGDQGAENVLRKQLTPLEPSTIASDATFAVVGERGSRCGGSRGRSGCVVGTVTGLACKPRGCVSRPDQMQHCCGEFGGWKRGG